MSSIKDKTHGCNSIDSSITFTYLRINVHNNMYFRANGYHKPHTEYKYLIRIAAVQLEYRPRLETLLETLMSSYKYCVSCNCTSQRIVR